MTKQLASLQKQRVQLAEDIQRAAADGDVRENAPLEAARENQGMVVAKIREIESTLKAATVLDDGSSAATERVQIGAKLELTEISSGRTINYQLVEPNEASPLNGKISILSPVGAAILSRRVGEQVTVVTPRGEQVYRIDSVT
jgi:transcription elongation factor GreA